MTTRTIKGVLDEAAADGAIGTYDHGCLRAELANLEADAQRFRGLRLILTEQDKVKQLAMLDAMEKFMGQQPEMDEANAPTVTAKRVNEIADQLILAAHGARNADG